jgi:hypothetical protein
MNSAYYFNRYKGQLLIEATFSGSFEWPLALYTGLNVHVLEQVKNYYSLTREDVSSLLWSGKGRVKDIGH